MSHLAGAEEAAARFEEHRRLLFGIAYRMLGSAADAEDVVQDAWLRWSAADRADVVAPRGYLVRVVTTTALNRLRSAGARRESYVGPWLPEPLLVAPDMTERVEIGQSVSMAMMIVMETLSPLERAVFVLREVFGYSHGEIARLLGRSQTSVRQVAHRAREHVRARRPRFDTRRDEQRRVTEQFLAACAGADLAGLISLLAPDVRLTADSGGKAKAPRRVIVGASKVARFLLAVAGNLAGAHVELADVNGAVGAVVSDAGEPAVVVVLDVAGGRAERIYMVNNPDKLTAVAGGPKPG